jgi:penicillin-insensitive murein endopeptidase
MFTLKQLFLLFIFLTALMQNVAFTHDKSDKILAKKIFGNFTSPTQLSAESIGRYNKGCLNGGVELPVKAETWQHINSKRGRNWGHPTLIDFTKELSVKATQFGWKGLYIGDLGNPRGGPTPYGHAAHQTGLEVDIKFKKPESLNLSMKDSHNDHRYGKPSFKEVNVVAKNQKNVNSNWTQGHMDILKAAAKDERVNKIFVNAAIKVWMCKNAGSEDRSWLMKIRPERGHSEHFHVRLKCPEGSANCVNTPLWNKYKNIDGCDKQLVWWVTDRLKPKKKVVKKGIKIKKKYKCSHARCYLPEDLPKSCLRTMHIE